MNDKQKALIEQIDALLPQTQCTLCEYPGCKPYATAIVENGEAIDHCLPGGVRVLRQLGELLNQDPEPFVAEMVKKQKPDYSVVIREDECIGCTKCIQACPVDAIIGASKQMHTVIQDACTGCELCIEPCPVDCIDLIDLPKRTDQQKIALAEQSRQRYQHHNFHTERRQQKKKQQHQSAKLSNQNNTVAARKQAIAAALARVKGKKRENDSD